MARKSAPSPMMFADAVKMRHARLFLPKLLAEESDRPALQGAEQDRAHKIILNWADMADAGHLNHKETKLDDLFLSDIFGDALGYKSLSENPNEYHREKQYTVKGEGFADGALGRFKSGEQIAPTAIIELKGADTDLDHDRSNGRTPVKQCWDYLNQLPETPWGIVSNYVTIRLYHRDSPARAYEEFTMAELRDPARFRQFHYIFQREGLLGGKIGASTIPPRAVGLLKRTQSRQRDVGNDLYEEYSNERSALIEHLMADQGRSQDEAIHIAQKILDRIIFVAFCEDRALLPEKLIHRAYTQLPAFTKVVNPRWQNFKNLFGLIDKGHDDAGIPKFNGGLFREDRLVDDLELDDQWTHFFSTVSGYDFRDEVNVDVLGHLFERSVTELEKLRIVGLFGKQGGSDGQPAMPKSAERKRFGIYYTPPEFTRHIIENTLGAMIQQRVEPLADLESRVAELRKIKLCDPACGSGAFLIAAYEKFEEAYEDVARAMRVAGMDKTAEALQQEFPDYILADNIYGVDLSAESVEITQLALWIRSARKGRTLADLSGNIVWGNSLINDPNIHRRAMTWASQFPAIFSGGGFDIVVGNPPWERMKLQEREFFSLGAPDIAAAVSAADRRKMIAKVETERPELWTRYQEAKAAAERTLAGVRSSKEFPFTARGDVNTYMLFAELARKIVAPAGRIGLLLPSGIATDDTTKHFFNDVMEHKALIALYDFENKAGIFPDVDGRFKFCVLILGGAGVRTPSADFVFFAHQIEDLKEPQRHIELTDKDLKLLNPNTKTCPIFRSQRDAELTRKVYRTVPILLDRNRKAGGNPWGIKFATMFHQTNDAEHFKTGKELKDDGFKLHGNRWINRKQVYLPLYEAKMIQAYDHRAAGVVIQAGNWMRQGQTEETSLVEQQNPEFVVMSRYWVAEAAVNEFVATRPALLAYKDVTSATNQRTMIAAMIPRAGVVNSAPYIRTGDDIKITLECCLVANFNALAYDFVARQKVGGLHLNFFIVEQLPTLPPERYDDRCPWKPKVTLEAWISERVLKLTCTADDMIPLAEAAGFAPPVHRWNEEERAQLRAELDAAYFILYGIERADVEYILGTFQGIVKEDEAHGGEGITRRLVMECFDKLSG